MNSFYEEIIIHASKKYPVLLSNTFAEMQSRLPENTLIITDKNLFSFYSEQLKNYDCIVLDTGEEIKQWTTVEYIFNELIKRNIGRDTLILGFGGGVVLDLVGFAASLFKRGCKFAFVATSLLAMADASVGGKNGINFGNLKNLIGTINQPEWVVCDVSLLNTLPDEDYKSGLGEIIKYAIIADKNLFQFMKQNNQAILNKDFDVLNHLIESSVHIKSGFVVEDEFDHGKRQFLNFGHSFGHAIETRMNIKHGIAVAKGMLIATKISAAMNLCNKTLIDKISDLISSFNISLDYEIDDIVWQSIANDKKNRGSKIRMVLIRDIGDVFIQEFDIEELKAIVQKI